MSASNWDDLPPKLWEPLHAWMTARTVDGSKEAERDLLETLEAWAFTNVECTAMLFAGTYYEQPEYCEEIAAPGSDYCHRHTDDRE